MKARIQILLWVLLSLSARTWAKQVDLHLSNGMHVIVVEDHRAPVASYVLLYAVGSVDDPAHKTGLAHFTEHLVLTRTGEAAVRYEQAVERCGGTFNASTGHDAIRFYATVPSANLMEVLSYEAARMKSPRFTLEGLETERRVVEQERAQGHEDKPYGLAEDHLDELAASSEAYRHPVIGYPADIKSITYDDAVAFVAAHYSPANATLALVGDIDATTIVPQLEQLFGSVRASGTGGLRRPPTEKNNTHGDYAATEKQGRRPRLYMAFQLPPRASREASAITLLDNILVTGTQARLRQALVEADLALAVFSDFEFRRGGGLYYLIVTLRSAQDADRVRQTVERTIEEVATAGVPPQELRRARLSVRADQAIKAEASMYRATQIALGAAIFGDAQILDRGLQQQEHTGSSAIAEAARHYLGAGRRVTLLVQPVSQ